MEELKITNTNLEHFYKSINAVINPPTGVSKLSIDKNGLNIDKCKSIYYDIYTLREHFAGDEGGFDSVENVIARMQVDLMILACNNNVDLGLAVNKIYNEKLNQLKKEADKNEQELF